MFKCKRTYSLFLENFTNVKVKVLVYKPVLMLLVRIYFV